MIIVLYIFLGLCAFFIGLPLAISIVYLLFGATFRFCIVGYETIKAAVKAKKAFLHLEQCRNCKHNDHIYNDKNDPSYYGVCCTKNAVLFRYKFIVDPGKKCKNYEKKDEVNP